MAQGGHRQLSEFQKGQIERLYNHETLIGCGFDVAGWSGEKSEKAEGPLVNPSGASHVTLTILF